MEERFFPYRFQREGGPANTLTSMNFWGSKSSSLFYFLRAVLGNTGTLRLESLKREENWWWAWEEVGNSFLPLSSLQPAETERLPSNWRGAMLIQEPDAKPGKGWRECQQMRQFPQFPSFHLKSLELEIHT
jgi:hypothetical protein